jgi:hypothetical protein
VNACGAPCTGNGGHCHYDALWDGACYWHAKLRPGGMPVAEEISQMARLLSVFEWESAQEEARVRGIRWLVELGGERLELNA